MSIQTSDTVANDGLDAVELTVGASPSFLIYDDSAAPPADCAAAATAALLATLSLPADWLAAAGSRQKLLAGTWSGPASAGAAATPGYFRINVGPTCHIQGTCGIGSGDLSFDGPVTAGQTITITAFTVTDGNP